jgi:hypothetical protein
MTSPLEARIQAVDADTLTPIALRAVGRAQGRLTEWTAEPMRPTSGNWGSSVIYRFSGSVQAQESALPWSVVLKASSGAILPVGGGEANVAALQREVAFYGSDLVHAFPSGFRPPHCYARSEHADEAGHAEYWLWLEDLSPDPGSKRSTVDDYDQVAYALGFFAGTFADPGTLARCAWLGRGACKRYIERAEPQFRAVFADRSNPLLRRAFPDASVERLVTWWASRHRDLQTLDRLPKTLCHGDPVSHNLFTIIGADGRREVVAIDWCAVGLGPIGADAAQYHPGLFDLRITVEQFAERCQILYERYLAGVQAAGWVGDPRLVRLGYTASMIRVKALVVNRCTQFVLDDAMRARVAHGIRAQGATVEDGLDRVRDLEPLLDGWLEESYALRDELL